MTKHNSHLHKCANCGFVWRHMNESPCRDNDEAHTCRCGYQQFFVHGRAGRSDVQTCERPCRKGETPVPMDACFMQDDWDKNLWYDPTTGDPVRIEKK